MELPETSHQTQSYFDLATGQLLIGEEAYAAHIEAGNHPGDIEKFGRILVSGTRMINAYDLPNIDHSNWPDSDTPVWIKHLHETIQREDPKRVVTKEVILRAGFMGLIPRIRYFRDLPGELSAVYNDAEVFDARQRDNFKHWTTREFVDYVQRLVVRFHGKPSYEQLKLACSEPGNPNLRQIRYRIEGGVSTLYEMAGFPNIRTWGYDQYIEWGVKFMFANEGRLPTLPALRHLHAQSLGPDVSTIYKNVAPFSKYKQLVQEDYDLEVEWRNAEREHKLMLIDNALSDGILSLSLYEIAQSEDELISIWAKYLVIERLLPNLEAQYKCQNSIIQRSDWFIRAIQRVNPEISAGRIEQTASLLGVFDDIWPLDDYMDYLKVPGPKPVKRRKAA